jgi:glyoxylase-like metal-dependent hydrolase (beta-lactamase superfamily II)
MDPRHTGHLALVVNTHWHADHAGGNGLLQATGAGIAASDPDAQAVATGWPTSPRGCCSPAHGPIPADPAAAFAVLGPAQRLVDDPAGAVWYGARRIFAFPSFP